MKIILKVLSYINKNTLIYTSYLSSVIFMYDCTALYVYQLCAYSGYVGNFGMDSKLISNCASTGCRSRARNAFVPTTAVNYLHSVLLHNSVSKWNKRHTIKKKRQFFSKALLDPFNANRAYNFAISSQAIVKMSYFKAVCREVFNACFLLCKELKFFFSSISELLQRILNKY